MGFDIDPNVVFRSMVSVALGRAVLRNVNPEFWAGPDLHSGWATTKKAWQQLIGYIEHRGIL